MSAEKVWWISPLGDTVNTAARLASAAAAEEVLLGEAVYAAVAKRAPDLEQRRLRLRGKDTSITMRVWRAAARQSLIGFAE
jgi:class 3 adenylate cyclase